jgi:hypothetical protein
MSTVYLKNTQLFPKVFSNGTDPFSKRQVFAGFEQKWQGSATLNKNLADLLNALEGS